jgi:DNA-binding NarL/FixJ family response regulator
MLMDVRMPILDGIEATRRIVAADGHVRVIMLTTFDIDEYVFAAIRAGASGFLLKDALPADLVNAVRVVARGDALLAPSVTRRMIERFAEGPARRRPEPASLGSLTDREREVLVQLARGLTNQEIAQELFIAEQTVKSHVSRVLGKLGVRDRAQAVVAAYESGLVVAAPPAHP